MNQPIYKPWRAKTTTLSVYSLLDLITGRFMINWAQLPPDAMITRAWPDPIYAGVRLIVESESFDPVPDGCQAPDLGPGFIESTEAKLDEIAQQAFRQERAGWNHSRDEYQREALAKAEQTLCERFERNAAKVLGSAESCRLLDEKTIRRWRDLFDLLIRSEFGELNHAATTPG